MLRLTGNRLKTLASERILVLDGAMGTMIQSYRSGEEDYRGSLLADHPRDLKGNNDILCLTRPQVIREIHEGYLAAGADIVTTNTFNGTSVSQADYGTSHLVREINTAAARLAREAADDFTRRTPDRPRFVAGSLAPTNRTCSISPDVNDPGLRNITFAQLVQAYGEEAEALLDGGVDLLMVETVFDPLNAKAAVFAVTEVLERRGLVDFPVWISGTITDASGRTLTGQTPEAFWISLEHARPAVFGLNCALGATAMRPFVEEVAAAADTLVSVHPNAGLPNELGGYDETPGQMAAVLQEFCRDGLVNIVGGCCGTTPEYVRAIAEAVEGLLPRAVPDRRPGTHLAGLEPLRITPESLFVNVGERTNVAGSRKFARLIREDRWEEALDVARQQVRGGAQIIDVNMDDAMLDAVAAMGDFLNVLAADPEISRVPVMIDSSRWEVIEAGLQRIQGKGIVNSISLKEGQAEFLRRARLVRRYGAAAVVMAFDEQGQADTLERRLEILRRAWTILLADGFPPTDVIFDPNVFAVATGIPEHDRYAVDFIAACRAIKQEMPGALVSGGVSNLSFSFRGNDTVREAMHSVFLYHAIAAGMDLGIVNAGQLAVYEDIEPDLLEAVEDVILARGPRDPGGPTPTERLTALAAAGGGARAARAEDLSWRDQPVARRLAHALLHGESRFVEDDTMAALKEAGDPLKVIEGPLMAGMNHVGELFGAGKMFLPQVIRSARVMKMAVDVLEPYLERGKDAAAPTAGRILLATVKGDVHDIGKNIVGVVLGCNNYEIIDLGVMVPAETIIRTAREQQVDFVGLSGLITPSLEEMVHVARSMQREGLEVPLLIGGATTSRLHTAVKIAPHYAPGVFHVPDASQAVAVVGSLRHPESRAAVTVSVAEDYERLRRRREESGPGRDLLTLAEARANAPAPDWSEKAVAAPRRPGVQSWDGWDLEDLAAYIDWTPFFQTWRLPGRYPGILADDRLGPEARRLHGDALDLLKELTADRGLVARAVVGLFPANADGDDVVVFAPDEPDRRLARVPFLRQQRRSAAGSPNFCLADFIAPLDTGTRDCLGAFVAAVSIEPSAAGDGKDDYRAILVQSLADRLAEALAERLHLEVRRTWWGYAPEEDLDLDGLLREEYRGIRPAPGYPACPDHLGKRFLFDLLDAERLTGAVLTGSCAILPAAAVAGWYFGHPQARYFGVGKIGPDQVADYARRAGIPGEEAARWLAANLP
ncbi:MAG: methionine synthase [bacterium]